MAVFTLREIAARTGGKAVAGDPGLTFHMFGIDSRLARRGELFFAVKGRRDGHDFVADAAAKGAAGAVVSRPVPGLPKGFGLILVEDTTAALAALAGSALAARRGAVKVVGVTGSVGKTTTKDFTAELVGARFRVLKSRGNFNNLLGLSLSLLELEPEHDAAVLEMGMSAAGEIRALTRVAAPDVAVITNVNPVHLGFFRGLEGIAAAKREILEGAAEGAVAVLNANDPLVMELASGWKGRRVLFGIDGVSDVRAGNIARRQDGGLEFDLGYGRAEARVRFAFMNEAMIENLLAAAAAALALGVDLDPLLARVPELKPAARRGVTSRTSGGVAVYDDSYNSNPRALRAALTSLAGIPAARKVAVLADMLELGPAEKDFHAEAGRTLAAAGWDVLVAVGPLAALIAESAAAAGLSRENIHLFPDSSAAAARIRDIVRSGDLVLVKGSRGMRTDIIADALLEKGGQGKE
jgi:UDP-N-acetylmuramoyl-tripeptide--D-alanyl-D-alanine ligase